MPKSLKTSKWRQTTRLTTDRRWFNADRTDDQTIKQPAVAELCQVPGNETVRLKTLHQYKILDTPPEPAFDDLTRLATHICGTPTALIVLTDTQRQWFKSKVGLAASEIPRDASFCAQTIRQRHLLIVQDACEDVRFANTPLVTSDPKIRFYAGVPLLTSEDLALGTLCVIDYVPRNLSAAQQEALQILARQVMTQLELRRNLVVLEGVVTQRQQAEAALLRAKIAEAAKQGLEKEIIERQRAEMALRESEERYALAASGANDGLWDWNLRTYEVYFSPRWKSMLGFKEDKIDNSLHEWFERVHPEDLERVKLELTQHFQGLTPHFESEHRLLHQDGTFRWMLSRGMAVQDSSGKPYRIAGSQTDITERKVSEARLIHNAFHDALTGLSNRALFMDRLGHAVKLAKRRQNYLFAVLFLDIDRFKVINDSLGHMSGDQLLIAFVQRLMPHLRLGDTIARLGGDEFAILVENINEIGDATDIANRIQTALTLPFNLSGQQVFTTVSIGIALGSTDYEGPEELLRDADIAMYHAKTLGKARYEVFNSAMHTRAVTLLQLENDLRRAVERQEFQIHYQPIVALETGRVTGFEALIRWQHPERGMVSPAEFIPVSEETGLIVPIGYWVLSEACRQMCSWQARSGHPPLTISVNLSAKQFAQADLIERIDQILGETGLDAQSLRLEITESVIMENAEAAAAMLLQLRSLGVQLYVDDFGTGYSSLSYLHRFPIDALKIDRSFIGRMGVDRESAEIVQTIVTLARNLGIYVVAEGVETAAQLSQLRTMNCKNGQGQGYFFSRPLNREAVEALIATQPQW